MGMSLTLAPRAGLSNETSAAFHKQVDFVFQMDARELVGTLADLAARGEIVCDIVPDEEDLPMEVADDEYDAEIDFSDEDVDVSDDELAEEGYRQSMTSDYELTVFWPQPGVAVCEVPEVGIGGYRGCTTRGCRVLDLLTKRQKVFRAVATWLENTPEFKQAGSLRAFLETFQPGKQRDFIKTHSKAGFGEVDLSRFIQNACLVGADEDDVRLPLRRLFS